MKKDRSDSVSTAPSPAGSKKDGQPLTWFTIAGEEKQFVPGDAVVKGDTVVVSSPDIAEPKAVRFAWHEKAMPNLFNGAGLPARPFRTDRP